MPKRSKIDLLGLVDRVITLYAEGNTIAQIETKLRGEGVDISRESIRRKLKSSREVATVYQKSLDEARVLLDAVRNNPNTDVIEVTNSLLAHKLFEFAKSVEELDFDDPMAFVVAVNRLSDAQVKVAKLRLDFQKGFEAAKKKVASELKEAEGKKEMTQEELLQWIRERVYGLEASHPTV